MAKRPRAGAPGDSVRADDVSAEICPDCGATLVDGACPDCVDAPPTDETKAAAGLEKRHAVMPVSIDLEELERRRAENASRADGEKPVDELLPISISSEHPVERYDYWEGERYNEVLDHSEGAVDLTRAKDGMPFLDSHNSYDGRAQMGRVMNVRVEKGQLRGDIKFSRRQEAQELRQDMLDGIKREISVGYRIDHNNLEKSQAEGDAVATVRIKRWMPYEASSVAIPADPTVGVGRTEDRRKGPRRDALLHMAGRTPTPPADNGHEGTMDKTDTPASPDVRVGKSAENEAAFRELGALAEQHGMHEKLSGWIKNGTSPDAARGEIITELKERLAKGPQFANKVDLSEKEERQYSFARAISLAGSNQDGFEMEVSRAIEAKVGSHQGNQGGTGNRLFIPTHIRNFPEHLAGMQKRSGLDSGTSTKGTELKFVQAGTFIEMLRAKARVLQLGATMLSGLDGPVTFPKQTGAGTFSWQGENTGTSVAVSALALGSVSLTAKTGMSATTFSKQLLRQSVVDVENMVRMDLAIIHALGVDLAAINGAGSATVPLGILQNTSVGVVALGTNGAAPDFTSVVKMEAQVETSNANLGRLGYLTTPEIKGTLKTTQLFATTNGVPVWLGGEEGELNGYPAFSSNQVPKNLTKGTSTTICHAIIFGSWENAVLGEWGAMEVLVDPYSLAGQGLYAVTSFQMIDFVLRYPESFSVIKDALKGSGF